MKRPLCAGVSADLTLVPLPLVGPTRILLPQRAVLVQGGLESPCFPGGDWEAESLSSSCKQVLVYLFT